MNAADADDDREIHPTYARFDDAQSMAKKVAAKPPPPTRRPLVCVESPYAGDVDRNLTYLRAALHDCIVRGEAPFASHGLYTQPGVLCDQIASEREQGIASGLDWALVADKTVVYGDLGVSPGMMRGIEHAVKHGRPIETRSLPGWASPGATKEATDAGNR